MPHHSLAFLYADTTSTHIACGILLEGSILVTCNHVFNNCYENQSIYCQFPYDSSNSNYRITHIRPSQNLDIAFCTLDNTPNEVQPAVLARTTIRPSSTLIITGITRSPERSFELVEEHPQVVRIPCIPDAIDQPDGSITLIGHDTSDYWPEGGCSGSPIFSVDGEQVCGILKESESGLNEGMSHLRTAIFIPSVLFRTEYETLLKEHSLPVYSDDEEDIWPSSITVDQPIG